MLNLLLLVLFLKYTQPFVLFWLNVFVVSHIQQPQLDFILLIPLFYGLCSITLYGSFSLYKNHLILIILYNLFIPAVSVKYIPAVCEINFPPVVCKNSINSRICACAGVVRRLAVDDYKHNSPNIQSTLVTHV